MSLPLLGRHSQIYGLCINAGEEDDINPWTMLIRTTSCLGSDPDAIPIVYGHRNGFLKSFVCGWHPAVDTIAQNPKTGYASIDAIHWFNYLAFYIVGDLAFGTPFGMLEKGQDVAEVRKSPDGPPTLGPFLPDRFFRDGLEAVEELVGIAVARVSESFRPEATVNNTRVDLLARLMEGRDEAGAKLGREELTADALTQLIAGSHTTSNTACAMLYWVLTTPGVKAKLQQILDNIIPNDVKAPPYSMVKDIQYLSWVISETMRIHSTSSLGLPWLIPEGASPVRIHDRVFRPGTVLCVPSYTIHHSTKIWGPGAEEFVPTRWDPARELQL
ncbi:hypothetical protein ACJ73_02075 [Blastomyces percursus]|uniref:Cytochrome P450 n=1 Tax=Blastomyces percursus TaxID=1658174 RepID=A0A1J9QEK5_9EURO|nr:hypothetical protein ACJ73_02075 [Blastomyces percursus]